MTLPKWRETATLKLNKETDQLTCSPFPLVGTPVSKFLKLVNLEDDPFQLDKLPFQRYKLCNVEINLGQVDPHKNLASKQFWEKLGPEIKYLHLEQCTLVQSTSVEVPVETLVLENAVNLEDLVVTQVKLKRKDWEIQRPKSLVTIIRERPRTPSKLRSLTVNGKICPFSIPEVIRCSGKLEKLSFKSLTDLNENLWKSLFAFRRLSHFRDFNLTEIDLMEVPNGLLIMDGVHRARLPVKTFRCQMGPGQELGMVRISAGFSRTLETLEIFGVKGDSGEEIHNVFVGELPELKELRIWGNVVKNLDFLRFMPKLKVLWMNLLCAEKWEEIGENFSGLGGDIVGEMGENLGLVFKGVESLRVDYEFGVGGLRILGKLMPSLKKLETVLNKVSFGIVGEMWPGLEELGCLFGSRVNDGVVTGMRLPVRARKEGDGGERGGEGIKQFRRKI